MPNIRKISILTLYFLATIQFVWCYLWITRPYVNTRLYELGRERMPFQGRMLMVFPMRWAHHSSLLRHLSSPFALSLFWFPHPVKPEVLIQASINVLCLLATGYFTTRIYQASSRTGLLTHFIYPLLLAACSVTYMLHTVQNFRFIYDLPSLAFFSAAMYLLYFRWHWLWFAALFLLATINRETTLLLLPLYMLNSAVSDGRFRWPSVLHTRTLAVVLPLSGAWILWQVFLHHHLAHNASELYPRIDWNLKSLFAPQAWPQLLSTCGYLLIFVVVMRRFIPDPRLHAWLWLLPVWFAFMFAYGILIETRVFGELIPLLVASTTLILEQLLLRRIAALRLRKKVVPGHLGNVFVIPEGNLRFRPLHHQANRANSFASGLDRLD